MARPLLALALLLVSCGSDHTSSHSPTCDPYARSGVYWVDYTTLSGDCGQLTDGLELFGPDEPLSQGCSLTAPDYWSADGCQLVRQWSCFNETTGLTVTAIATSTQETQDGSLITGIASAEVSEAGVVLCTGSYGLRAERQ